MTGRQTGSTPPPLIDGGCDDCSAYSELVAVEARVWAFVVRHDASCPYYRSLVAERHA